MIMFFFIIGLSVMYHKSIEKHDELGCEFVV